MAYAKRKPFKPGIRQLSKLESKIVSWCINNGIACCVVPAQKYTGFNQDFCIEIVINGKSNFSPNFKKLEVMDKQIEYYKYYYDKYNKTS
jgi:hypothetical protein|tara:strand:- start:826 stop:1095 length:270 start_codon:yes stop_codon:yes gene_type:complete